MTPLSAASWALVIFWVLLLAVVLVAVWRHLNDLDK